MVTAGEKRTPYPNGQGVCELSVLLTCVHRKSKTDHLEPFHPRLPLQELGSCRPEHGSFQPVPVQCQFGFSLHGQSSHHHIRTLHGRQHRIRFQSADDTHYKSSMLARCKQDGLHKRFHPCRQARYDTEPHDVPSCTQSSSHAGEQAC